MNILKFLTFFFLLTSCTESGKSDTKAISDNAGSITIDTSPAALPQVDNSKLTAMQFAEGIISGQIYPSDNEQTFAWLDSLQSDSKRTRDLAFSVYRSMCLKSDGALSEAICGHIKSYFEVYPSEFLDNYIMMNEKQKLKTTENIAFEFYASGTDYKNDIAEYFAAISKKCMTCFNNTNLQEIRSTIEKQAGKMNQ